MNAAHPTAPLTQSASASQAVICYVGLGANLDHPVAQLQRALQALDRLPGTRLRQHSQLYQNPPMGPIDQPDYVNAVAELSSTLDPFALLQALQDLEQQQGRTRNGVRWGPRTLDLDLLLYGQQQMQHPQLTLPHPGLPMRAFVLYPLAEIAPTLNIPGLGSLTTLLAHCPAEGLQPVLTHPQQPCGVWQVQVGASAAPRKAPL
ncbi:2-amino-4-hydroxy-6-hydroxymethyldihydropteridine diphosphokinase [Thiorhodospira sibirica]|uniref:2-amino-4-hydroxy-6- hydroxymethyldihydropteridine diphosphokinase n=1 Tax=Thiorhodospira sibirica TaxID=154347 RepID=UPI00022C170E|nr:2-amino-4-hydroxy-6-hydroxymethyldihydropteridine diphosphokinase [Thiorhodospira sibirica]